MHSRIAYLVHDLGDAAVARRVEGLQAGGGAVALAGFYRRAAPASIAGAPALAIGRSHDGRLAARALLVLRRLLLPGKLRAMVRGADVVMARNLEMLAIAARLARKGQPVVYECLDIHRSLLSSGPGGRVLRFIERRLLARTARVIVSSPAFERDYFRARQGWPGPVDLVENKVAALPGVEYAGPYRPGDLPRLYGRVHFAWCIDYFEEGLNSAWLLPNRLYESLAHGAVPLALADVETGRWLAAADVGLRLPSGEALGPVLTGMTAAQHTRLAAAVRALPRDRIAFSPEDHRRLVARLETIAA